MKQVQNEQLHTVAPAWIDFERGLIRYKEGQSTYLINQKGQTTILIQGNEFPIQGCPAPHLLEWAAFKLFVFKYRKVIPAVVLVVFLLVLLQMCLWLIPNAPLADMKYSFVASFSFWMNKALLVFSVVLFLSVLGRYVGLTVFFNPFRVYIGDVIQEVADPELEFLDIAPDILVRSHSDKDDTFADRLLEAMNTQKQGQWLVVIPYQHPSLIIRKDIDMGKSGQETENFKREKPPFNFTFPQQTFHRENWNEYREYVNEFSRHFHEWAKSEKVDRENQLQHLLNSMK